MDHLYRLGHRKIGLVTGPPSASSARKRLRGATARAKKEKADKDTIVMNGDFSVDSGVVAGERLLGRTRPPTAIFCFNDEMAMGVLHTARRRKIRVPDDLSIVGVDDIRYARLCDPPLDDGGAADDGRWASTPCACCWGSCTATRNHRSAFAAAHARRAIEHGSAESLVLTGRELEGRHDVGRDFDAGS
jgi:hypothetical protein